MRTITVRQLQRNFYKEILDLPVLVTKLQKPFLVLMNAEDYKENNQTDIKTVKVESVKKKSFLAELLGKE